MKASDRRYLYVPFEEYPQVKALRARWDSQKKCWYIGPRQDHKKFKRWLEVEDDGEFVIESDDAYVAQASVKCRHCGAKTEVICIFFEKGEVEGEPTKKFTVSNVWDIDDSLARQLKPYPQFREDSDEEMSAEGFMNHCSKCGKVLSDFFLHCEPGGPFFRRPKKGMLKKLKGKIRLSADEGFEVVA